MVGLLPAGTRFVSKRSLKNWTMVNLSRKAHSMTLRRLLFWLHLSVGIVAGLLIGFLALTGAILSFQPQLVAAAERGRRAEHPANTACVAPSVLLRNAGAVAHRPLTSLTIFADPRRPAQVTVGEDGAVLLADACTGRILGPGANSLRVALTTVRELHRQASFHGVRHETLRSIKNAAVLPLVGLLLSGLVLWAPRQLSWRHLRPAVLLRKDLHGRAREWNLHTVTGFWLCLPLLAISVTGIIMAYPWANALLFRAAGEPPPAPRREAGMTRAAEDHAMAGRGAGASHSGDAGASAAPDFTVLDAPIAQALHYAPAAESTSVRLPAADTLAAQKTLVFQLSQDGRGQSMNRDQLTVSVPDSAVLKWEPFVQASRGRRWRVAARYLHTGEIFGAAGQTVALVSVLGTLVLVWTGVSLSLRRLAAWRHRRRRRAEPLSPRAGQTTATSLQTS